VTVLWVIRRGSDRLGERDRFGVGDPEKGLAEGIGAADLGGCGVRDGREGLPLFGVLGVAVGAAGEEEADAAAGEVGEVGGIGGVGPGGSVGDEWGVEGDGGSHARAVLELVVPDALEAGGEEIAGGAEEVEVEEGVAVRVGGGDLVGEFAGGVELGAEGDGAEAMAEEVEVGVVRGETGGGEMGAGGGLEKPGAAVVVLLVAGEGGERVFGEPFQVVGEPGAEG